MTERLLFPPPPTAETARARPQPDWTVVDKEMRRKGVTMALLWEEYRAAHPDGFGYSWFCENYAAFKSRLRPSMRQEHRSRRGSSSILQAAPEASSIKKQGRYVAHADVRGGLGRVELHLRRGEPHRAEPAALDLIARASPWNISAARRMFLVPDNLKSGVVVTSPSLRT